MFTLWVTWNNILAWCLSVYFRPLFTTLPHTKCIQDCSEQYIKIKWFLFQRNVCFIPNIYKTYGPLGHSTIEKNMLSSSPSDKFREGKDDKLFKCYWESHLIKAKVLYSSSQQLYWGDQREWSSCSQVTTIISIKKINS